MAVIAVVDVAIVAVCKGLTRRATSMTSQAMRPRAVHRGNPESYTSARLGQYPLDVGPGCGGCWMLEPLDAGRALGRHTRLYNGLPERYELSFKADWKKLPL